MKHDIQKLFIGELQEMRDAKTQIALALPTVIDAIDSPELREIFKNHVKEGQAQTGRIDEILKLLGSPAINIPNPAVQGLLKDVALAIENWPKSPVRDAAIISKAQRVAHYQISAYGTLRTFANELELEEVAELLQDSLDEEARVDKKLTKIAEGGLFAAGINHKANE